MVHFPTNSLRVILGNSAFHLRAAEHLHGKSAESISRTRRVHVPNNQVPGFGVINSNPRIGFR